jgi:ribosomal protein L37E
MVTMICRECGRRYNYTVTDHCPECDTYPWDCDDATDGGEPA